MFHHDLVCRFLQLISNHSSRIKSLQTPSFLITSRFISTISNSNQFTLDYLVNKCGLSPQSALKASKHIFLKSTTNPDSVLLLLRNYGFTQSHISKLIADRPSVLLANPDEILRPKLDFFTNMGISGPNLGKLLSRGPKFLTTSLDKQIIPSIHFLKKLVHTDSNIAFTLNRSGWILHDAECKLGPNVTILQDHGVPQPNISKFVMTNARKLYGNFDRLNIMVLELKKLGVCPSSMMFLHGLHILLAMKKPLWDAKLEAYKSFGWSEAEVLSVFKKYPFFMKSSTKKISLALDFFMNILKWNRGDVSNIPAIVSLSLEKRVIPRVCVLQILLSKELIAKNSMSQGLIVSEDMFVKKYVIKYHHEVPDLMKVYQSKIGTQGLLQGSENGSKMDKI